MVETADHKTVAQGVMTIIATVFAMALADAFIKYSSAGMTLWQIWVLRSALVVPVLMILARNGILPAGLGWVLLRSLILALMYLGIYAAIPLLDLSVTAAALYTGPLFIVALSALALNEPVTWRHWIAVLIGFGGVLMIVRPLAAEFTPLTLLPIAAAFLYAVAAVLTRARCAETPATTLALWLNLTLLGLGGVVSVLISALGPIGAEIKYPFLFGRWQGMDAGNWQLIAGLSVLMIGISIGLARAYQSPRPQVITTFDYTYLIFASFWGYVLFGEVPDGGTLTGMGLIAVAGLTVLAVKAEGSRTARRGL
jgi:drug/metabolite transporter (DMT)-like permease